VNRIAQGELARARYRCVLTGDIAPEGPQDIFEQIKFVYGHFMGRRKFWPWRDEHFRKMGYEWLPLPGHYQSIKEALHARSYTLTRKDAGIKEQKTFERRFCDLPKDLARAYTECERHYRLPPATPFASTHAFKAYGNETKYAVAVASWLAQLAGGYVKGREDLDSPHKMMLLAELLLGEYRHEKVVVTFRFNRELEAAGLFLEKNKINHAVIRGGVSLAQRADIQDRFRRSGLDVLLMQVKAVKHGADLSAADTMIRYSLPYNYDDVAQPADRIFHPAKDNVLHYIDLVARRTVDEDIVEVAQDKTVTARFFMEKLTSRLIDRLRAAAREAA
jgi:SNF2 family DNA or RNA helicase